MLPAFLLVNYVGCASANAEGTVGLSQACVVFLRYIEDKRNLFYMCKCGELRVFCPPSTGGETNNNKNDRLAVVTIVLRFATGGFFSGTVGRR